MVDPIDSISWSILVLRCQVGDRNALEDLVGHCSPRLRGFLFKMVSDQERLNDLEQDVWADVFRDLPKLKSANAFIPWMFRIARNRVFRMLRHDRHSISFDHNIEAEAITDDQPSFTADQALQVYNALERLSPERREVILLRFIENLNYDDIAMVVGRPIGTVKSRIHSAKRQLRQILEKEERR